MTSQNPIDTLLEAERAAEVEIERRHEAARGTVNRALEAARVISERAHRRITNIHTHCAATVKTQCDAMWRSYQEEPETVMEEMATPERLERVAVRVAEKLTVAAQEGERDA